MAILYGTTSTGDTLPVQVDQAGRLVAEGLQGPVGPEGPPGVGALPPNPQDGQVLGWENGQLAWVDGGASAFFFYLDLLVVAGGGSAIQGWSNTWAGGGAGGFYQTMLGNKNPDGSDTTGAIKIGIDPSAAFDFELTAGLAKQASSFVGHGVDLQLQAGGDAGDGNAGGSGGGGHCQSSNGGPVGAGGAAQVGYGNAGARGDTADYAECYDPQYVCNQYCNTMYGGGGGGAGGAAIGVNGGPGITSDITGTSILYGVGGNGQVLCPDNFLPPIADQGAFGGGGTNHHAPQDGAVILRYPDFLDLIVYSGTAQRVDGTHLNSKVTTFTGGSVQIKFAVQPAVVMSTYIDYLRSR